MHAGLVRDFWTMGGCFAKWPNVRLRATSARKRGEERSGGELLRASAMIIVSTSYIVS
jgi:hypothetical protein